MCVFPRSWAMAISQFLLLSYPRVIRKFMNSVTFTVNLILTRLLIHFKTTSYLLYSYTILGKYFFVTFMLVKNIYFIKNRWLPAYSIVNLWLLLVTSSTFLIHNKHHHGSPETWTSSCTYVYDHHNAFVTSIHFVTNVLGVAPRYTLKCECASLTTLPLRFGKLHTIYAWR